MSGADDSKGAIVIVVVAEIAARPDKRFEAVRVTAGGEGIVPGAW